jgi:predicted O-methyltransferase YrrM
MDTLGMFRKNIARAGLEDCVVAIIGASATVARWWRTPLSLLFIDGGHGVEPARTDYRCWTPWVAPGGVLIIHDVFPDPAEGGRPPYEEIYRPALESGLFEEVEALGSMRVLRRVTGG